MFVKICGMNSAEAVDAAVAAGADALGFVFAPSVRQITPEAAARLAERVPKHVLRVAVMRHPTPAQWAQVVSGFAPDWVQTDAEDLAALELPADCAALPVYRDGRAPDAGKMPARLLFEGAVSGSGRTADWDAAARLGRGAELVLAGGLHTDNVGRAIERVRPWGVDVSSGVERERGTKDPRLIEAFIARVRALEATPC